MSAGLGILLPLRYRDFRLLAVGSLISLLGDGVFRVTIAVQVLAINNDPRALSAVAASWAIAQFLTLPAGGWAADRFERRTVMLVADLVRGVALTVLAALSLSGDLGLWHLCVLGAMVGAGNGFFNPTAISLVPDLLPAAALERANALMGVARPMMLWIVGPLLGASVIRWGGPGAALGFDAVTFAVSALFLFRIARRPVAFASGSRGLRRTFSDLAEGFHFVHRRRWAWAWIVAAGVSTMVHSGVFEVLLPTLLVNELRMTEAGVAAALAGAFAAGGAGSVLASTVLGQRGLPRRFISVLFGAEALALLATAGYAGVSGRYEVAALGLIIFTLFAVTDVIGTTLLQRLVPRRLLGRVSSLDWMASVGLAPAGFILAGPLAFAIGPRAAIVAMGTVGFVVVTALALVPGVLRTQRLGHLRDLSPDDDPPGGTPASSQAEHDLTTSPKPVTGVARPRDMDSVAHARRHKDADYHRPPG